MSEFQSGLLVGALLGGWVLVVIICLVAFVREGVPRYRQGLKCPFCGGRDLYLDGLEIDQEWHHFVACRQCSAEGPIAATEPEAWALWGGFSARVAMDGPAEAAEGVV